MLPRKIDNIPNSIELGENQYKEIQDKAPAKMKKWLKDVRGY